MYTIFDNIIFSLQKSGGISTLWGELIESIDEKKSYQPFFLEYKNHQLNIVRKKINIKQDLILNLNKKENLKIERFKNPSLKNIKDKFIFISSYYRTSSNKNAINVTLVHDFTHERYHKGVRKLIHTNQKRRAIKNSSGIICISENTKKDLLYFFPETDPSKIKVIHNGVADHFFPIEKEFSWQEIDQDADFLDQKKCITFIGARAGYKNFSESVLAVAKLPKEYHFVIIGAALNDAEEKFVNDHLKKENYTVFSAIDNQKLNKIYNKSFCLLYPSSYEGFGIPVLEAMKTGLPVICYKGSSIPEVAGDAGIFLDNVGPDHIKTQILKLESQNTYDSASSKGILQASKFSWSKTTNEYYHFFEELYSEKK